MQNKVLLTIEHSYEKLLFYLFKQTVFILHIQSIRRPPLEDEDAHLSKMTSFRLAQENFHLVTTV